MAQIGNIIETEFRVETSGVPTNTRMWWRINDIKGAASIFTNMSALAVAYWNVVGALVSLDAQFSCLVYHNVDENEKLAVFPLLPGAAAGGQHTSQQTLRVNRWGRSLAPPQTSKPVVNAINIAGTSEEFSERGRLVSSFDRNPIQNFMVAELDLGATGWDLVPQVRHQISEDPDLYEFYNCEQAEIRPRFYTLRKRKTKLCATS